MIVRGPGSSLGARMFFIFAKRYSFRWFIHIVQYKQVDYKITVFFSIVMVCGFATSRAQYHYWLGTPCATIRIIRKRTYFRFMGLVSWL